MSDNDTGTAVGGTDNTGHVYLTNGWGVDLYSVEVRHRRSNDPTLEDHHTFYDVLSDTTVGPFDITYTTGVGSPFDYWWIKITTEKGATFECKKDFYCSVSSSDDGTVKLRLDGAEKQLYVSFSSSSGCSVSIDPSPGNG